VDPVELSCPGIQAVETARHVGEIEEAVGNRDGRQGPIEPLVGPELAGRRDVARLGGVDAVEGAPAAPVRRIAADRHIDAVVEEDGRGDDLALADERPVVLI